jgi:hypothetical protein
MTCCHAVPFSAKPGIDPAVSEIHIQKLICSNGCG